MVQDSDTECKIINGQTGYTRSNTSWVLGRLMRDFKYWRAAETNEIVEEIRDQKWEELKRKNAGQLAPARPTRAGLVVTIYRPSTTHESGVPVRDGLYWSGIGVLVLQLGIAAIPFGLFGDWGILMITAAGIFLSLLTGSLPEWRREKWACRTNSPETYILTGGNGNQHAIVVLGNKRGLNLEDLAAGQRNIETTTDHSTRATLLILAALWVLLLITAAGLKTNPWFLLAVGAVGMVQKICVSTWRRRPENFGIPLEFVEVIGKPKVMETLTEVERRYPKVGRSMLPEFFPGKLRPGEVAIWEQLETDARAAKNATEKHPRTQTVS
jgi:Flp pilus assembly protein TadB